ncbi:MAG: DUF1684 domain-containing protein [Thermoanaerobaculia bacterium]|nr:DUF1684 domain-containing protein [Thermoanaerobaculia bacterium]
MRRSAVEPSALGAPVARRAGAFAGICLMVIACGTGPEPPSPTERQSAALDPAAYEEEIHDWRRARYERLTAPDGWLSLVGLFPLDADELTFGTGTAVDLAFGGSDEERTLGTIARRAEGRFVVRSAPGVEIFSDGEPVESIELQAGADGASIALDVPPYRFFVIERSGRYYLRVRDLTRVDRVALPEIDYFPIDLSWRLEARFEPYEPPRILAVPTVLDVDDDSVSPGALVFERNGASYRLDALESGDRLFVIFADRTTGDETYGGGRYLYTDLPNPGGSVVVDFNEAYNPPCVFTPYATCPLPPPQNRLDTAVTAGEKMVVGYLEH